MKKSAIKTQQSAMTFTEVGLYNQKVHDYLRATSLDTITQYTIKLFKDNAQRAKLSIAQYNQAVTEFNNTHGLLLLKKGNTRAQAAPRQYAYINFPFLNREAMKSAMDNYRQFVHKYNTVVAKENKTIAEYNKALVNPKQDQKISATIREFKKSNSHLFTRNYNQAVAELNTQLNAKYLAKKRIQTIKYTTELVFNVLVGFYISQLKTRNSYLLEKNRPTSVLKKSLPRLKIDQRKLATHTIAEIPRLNLCKKTAQNHIKRLREAGILINYNYSNQHKPIAVNFNPDIVEVLDGNPPKSQITENHFFKVDNAKKLPDNSDTTRTFLLKEKEIKECAGTSNTQQKNVIPVSKHSACPADSYKNTTAISKKQEIHSLEKLKEVRTILPDFLKDREPKQGTNSQLTANFLARLQDDRSLAQELANGNFDNYKGLRYDYLQKIEQYTHVTSEEFKAILIQDFIKSSAKIWKQHTVYVGEWKKTINYLNEYLFKNINHKSILIQKLQEYRWKLNFARKWFVTSKVSALYPSLYFDTTRTQANEIGFFGLHSVWKTHLKYVDRKTQEKSQRITQKNARKRKKTQTVSLTQFNKN